MFMIAMAFLVLSTGTFQVRGHCEDDRPPRSHQASSTPTVEIPLEAFPVPVQMLTPQPAMHEIKYPAPIAIDYYTGWPTNVLMYPISQPPFHSSPTLNSPSLPSARPVPIPLPVPIGTNTFAPINVEEGSTSNPSSNIPPLALSLPNTSVPSSILSERPVPVEASSAPTIGPSAVPTNCTDSAAPSSMQTGTTERPTIKQQVSAAPSNNITSSSPTASQPTISTLSPFTIVPPITLGPTHNPGPVITPSSTETERPSVAPLTTPEPIPLQTTAPTADFVNSVQPSATESSHAPSARFPSSWPSREETSHAPHAMPSTMPSVSALPACVPSTTQTHAPDVTNGSKKPTADPTAAHPVFPTTVPQKSLLPSSLSSVFTTQPSLVLVNSVAPTVLTTAVPAATTCAPSMLPTVAGLTPSRIPTQSSTEKSSAAPTVSTAAAPSAVAGRSGAPSNVTPPTLYPSAGSVSPTLDAPMPTRTMLPTISGNPSTTAPTAPANAPLSPVPSESVPPSNQPNYSPTIVSRSPTPTLQPSVISNTALPTRTVTSSVPHSPTQASSTVFLLLNVTVQAVIANFTTGTESFVLSRSEQKCVEDGVWASLTFLRPVIFGVHVFSRQQETVASYATPSAVAWTLDMVITMNITQKNLAQDSFALQQAFNASLYTGMLQKNTRAAALVAKPPIASMIMVIFCAENDPNRCLATVTPTQPAAGGSAEDCKRDGTEWHALYNTPAGVPWYLVWTIALLAVWVVVAVWATCHIPSRAAYVTGFCCAYVRVAYFALLLAQYFNDYPSATRTSLACIEFAYLDTNNEEQFYLTWTMILMRSLFYPLLLLQVSQTVRDYWNCRNTRDTLYLVLTVLAVLCVFILFVSYTVLLSTHDQSAAAAVVDSGWIVQLLCGALLLLHGARLCLGGLLQTRARRLSDVYGDPHSNAVAEPSWKHSSVEAKTSYRDLQHSRLHYRHEQNAIAAESAFERSPAAQMWMITTLLLLSAVLVIVTAIPQTLTVVIAAFVLYSVLARVSEILLVVALLQKSISMSVYLRTQDDHTDLPELSILSSTHDKDIPTNNINSMATGMASFTSSRKLPSFRAFSSQPIEHAGNITQKGAPPSLSDLSERSFTDRTIWNKKWPWVVTPSNDIAVHVAEQQQQQSVEAEVLYSPQRQVVPGDSNSDDSTDSSGTYFV